MKLFTIGFTKSKAREFFGRLERSGVRRVYDTRLNRASQLAGFAKQDDLSFFLSRIGEIEYSVEALLAPTADMLDAYRKKEMGWPEYERRYLELLDARKVEKRIDLSSLNNGCLLCSEATPEHCHRRLAADYLAKSVVDLEIIHL
ncbi:DUF488 domain-containing protein [Sphingomonas sp. S-NIH.Pt15_0812]|uniref:DUF488 domain-containing protein n=1 Tax=Sphingomonas sp. S-NIH.Pt15_0812 TaxID=1920129 RepID=UPI000F7F66B7|nr:DUF488 domain-containing protein [Sphingomonas sp. S-NIH.Pt15_0812]RSU45574.1 hypothetical protein BRX43_18360 [Sphingomonas sp. S-NIH.Pt15_0812]